MTDNKEKYEAIENAIIDLYLSVKIRNDNEVIFPLILD